MSSKLQSRKFWISVAAFLGSVAASIAGLATENEIVAGIGIACGIVSAGIYVAAEAYIDGQGAKSTQTVISATTYDSATVNKLLVPEAQNEG